MLGYSLAFDALTTPVNVVDIHGPGTLQSGAPVIATLPIGDEPSHVGPYSGTLMLTPEQAADLLAGQFYIDIHTDLYRDGEIRGQIYLLPN